MKKIMYIVLSVFLLMLSGCQSTKEKDSNILETITLDEKEAMTSIASASKFSSSFIVGEDYFIENLNYEQQEGIEVFGMFGSILDGKRIVIFKMKTQENKNYVTNYIELMKTRLQDMLLDDMEAEKELIANGITLSEKNYIVFISGEDASLGSEAFQELIK